MKTDLAFLQSLIPEEQRKGLNADSTIVPVVDTLAAVRRSRLAVCDPY